MHKSTAKLTSLRHKTTFYRRSVILFDKIHNYCDVYTTISIRKFSNYRVDLLFTNDVLTTFVE